MITKILTGHTSPETAYVIGDYPYGYTLRCKIRYWLEHKPKHGFRFVSQTTNPKRPGEFWNKPKASTYCRFGACMFLNEDGHVKWAGLNQYCDGAEAQSWLDTYGAGVPEAGRALLNKFVAAKVAYDAARKPSDPLEVGMVEAAKAFVTEGAPQ
jgi:hypothetical protein